MMGRTHLLLGLSSLWLLYPLPDVLTPDTLAPLVMGATLGALLPDLDAQGSILKYWQVGGVRPLVPLADLLHKSFGHRGLLHSLWGLGAACILGLPLLWLGWAAFVGLLLGYASHLVGDASTKSGIPLLYPKTRRLHLLPKPWRLTTGSQAEDALLPLLGVAVLALLLSRLPLTTSL